MHQFRREAHRIGSNGGKAGFIQCPVAQCRKLHLKAQAAPEGAPEGHGVPERKAAGQADGHIPRRGGAGNRIFLKQQLLPQAEQIGGLLLLGQLFLHLFLHAGRLGVAQHLAPLTPVVGHPGAAGGEGDDGPLAMVGAEGAGRIGRLGVAKCVQRVQPDESFLRSGGALFLGQQGHADGAHDAGVRGAHHFPAQILFHCAQYRVVLEGTALHHDLIAQRIQVGHPNDLGEHIFNDGTAQPGHNVVGLLAVALFGHDAAVHKHGAAAAQRRWALRRKGRSGDFFGGNVQRRGKVLQERTATRRTRLVHHNVGDDAPIQPDGLHILPADVQQEAGSGHILLRCTGMGNSLHCMAFGSERLCKQHLAVSGGAGCQNVQRCAGGPVAVPQCDQGLLGHIQRAALVRGIKRVQQVFLLIHQHKLRGGAAGVNAQIGVHRLPCLRLIRGQHRQAVAVQKGFLFRFVFEERRRRHCGFCRSGRGILQPSRQFADGQRL